MHFHWKGWLYDKKTVQKNLMPCVTLMYMLIVLQVIICQTIKYCKVYKPAYYPTVLVIV